MSEIEMFLMEQYLISDSYELDMWLAHLARNAGCDWLADVIKEAL